MALLASILLAGVTVTLPVEAKVRGTEIELGEIATIQGDDAAVVAQLRELEIGYAPAPGYSRLLRLDMISRTVRTKAPGVQVRFAGERALRVWPEVEEISVAAITAAGHAELQRVYGGEDTGFVRRDQTPRILVPAGAASHAIRARQSGRRASPSKVSLPIDILVDGARYRTVWTSWDVEVWRTMPVLARDVRAGQLITPSLLESRRVRVESDAGADVPTETQLFGGVITRDLKAGTVLASADVKRPTVMSLGDTVFLRVKKGHVEARVSAVALQAGAVGDRIRIRTIDSKQELTARIVSRDTVEIDLRNKS